LIQVYGLQHGANTEDQQTGSNKVKVMVHTHISTCGHKNSV